MSDSGRATPNRPDPARSDPARQRFIALGIFRLSGALIALFGLAIGTQRFGWVQGDKARMMGTITILVGLVQFLVVPRMLARAWRTPPDP